MQAAVLRDTGRSHLAEQLSKSATAVSARPNCVACGGWTQARKARSKNVPKVPSRQTVPAGME